MVVAITSLIYSSESRAKELRPSLVDQHGTADCPLDAPDVAGLLRQSSFFSVRVGRQTTSRSLSSVKIMEPQALLLRDTQSI